MGEKGKTFLPLFNIANKGIRDKIMQRVNATFQHLLTKQIRHLVVYHHTLSQPY